MYDLIGIFHKRIAACNEKSSCSCWTPIFIMTYRILLRLFGNLRWLDAHADQTTHGISCLIAHHVNLDDK
jgi:hypothetical protein